jgi:hypothetical protein
MGNAMTIDAGCTHAALRLLARKGAGDRGDRTLVSAMAR